jgi:HEAT repeats
MLSPRRPIHRGRQAWLSAGLCLGLIAPAAAEEPGATRPVEVEVASGMLTLQADGAPLAEVLRAIGEAGGFEVVLRGAFATAVHDSFAGRPLEDALRQLARGHSLVILHGEPDPASSAAALAGIRVIENPTALEQTAPEPPIAAESVPEEGADQPPMDREAFRLANLGVPAPTREDILLELGDADQATRVAAVPKVGALAPQAALGVLSGVLAAEDDPLVRSRAVAALTRLDGPGARMLLRERALADDDPELRVQALNALAASRGERALNVLGQALGHDPDPEVRVSAVQALGRVGGDRARRTLQRAARDPDPAVSSAAEQALAAWPRAE